MIKMRLENKELDELLEKAKEYDHMIAYMMSSLWVGNTREFIHHVLEKTDELLEARFFSKHEELHIFLREEQLQAVQVRDEQADEVLVHSYPLFGKFKHLESLQVKQYIQYDKDGQAYIALTRCVGFVKGGKIDEQSNGTL